MANVLFKQGTQASLDTIRTNKTAIEGSFYLTNDTHRLYIGRANGDAVPVNEGVNTVATLDDLPNVTSQNAPSYVGQFYYVTGSNILCVYSASVQAGAVRGGWVQINPNTDTHLSDFNIDITVINGVATVSTAITETSGDPSSNVAGDTTTKNFQVAGAGGITISTTNGANAGTGDILTITGDQYSVAAGNDNAALKTVDLQLSSTTGHNSSVTFKGSDTVNVTKDGTAIKIDAVNTQLASATGANESQGFSITVADTAGNSEKATIDPIIVVGGETANQQTFHFVNGTATLAVYTKEEIDSKMSSLDSMTYRGTIGATRTLGQVQNAGVQIGDTYLLDGQVNGINTDGNSNATAHIGDMIIARGTEDTNGNITVTYKPERTDITKQVNIPSLDSFMNYVNEDIKAGSLSVESESQSIWVTILGLLMPFGLIAIFLVFWFLMMSGNGAQGGNKTLTFGKSRARMLNSTDKNKVTFDDVAGVDEEKEELQEIVEFLKNPKKFTDMGARIPKGVLLVGQPGTGKTLLAKAVAGEAGVPFFIISGSDFVEMFVGVGASRVRDLFEQAKKNAPCIIFIDEIDAVGRQRGAGLGGGHDEREQTLNQLLVEMDGFSANEGVIVLAATNRPDVLDKALLRPGRFDRQIVVGAPDVKAREQILEVHSRKKKLAEDVDLKIIAKNTSGFAGADLENVLNEAALLAARRNLTEIGMREIEDAMVKVTMGPEKKTRVRNEHEKKLVAYHEAGHAVVSKFLPTQDPVHEISIVPRGMAGGYTMYRPTEDKSFISKTYMEETIVSLLGGRVAESLILDDISTGASNDIERATKMARSMVTVYGMSERLGAIMYDSDNGEVFLGRDLAHSKTYSEETAAIIDEEVKRIVDTAYEKAKKILSDNIDKLHIVAGILLEKEKIDGEEFDKVFES